MRGGLYTLSLSSDEPLVHRCFSLVGLRTHPDGSSLSSFCVFRTTQQLPACDRHQTTLAASRPTPVSST
ncbi:hypothetical protein PM082_015628 [Marasmius tenuissimus]|nr:hypothetical protein PM082_015628 [Marasmius tenuissimus]